MDSSPAQSGETSGPDWGAHTSRAGRLIADVPVYDGFGGTGWPGGQRRQSQWLVGVLAEPPEVAVSLLMLLLRKARAEEGWDPDTSANVRQILRRGRFTLPVTDAAHALRIAAELPGGTFGEDSIVAATAMAARSQDLADPGLLRAARELAAEIDGRRSLSARPMSKIRKNLALLRPPPAEDQPVDTSPIAGADGWSAAVLARLANQPGPSGQANALLAHLMSASGSKPARSWFAAAHALMADAGARQVLRSLVECVGTAKPALVEGLYGFTFELVVASGNSDLVRAACWATVSVAGEDWAIPALTAVVRRQRYMISPKVPNAAIHALGQIATPEAISALQDLQRATKHAGYRKQIAAAVTAAAQRAGLSPGQLAERVVATGGLSASGERLVTSGGHLARITISPERKAQAEWQTAAGWSRKTPTEAGAEPAREVKRAVTEVGALLAAERGRLEGLVAEDRGWDIGEWRRYYLDHPITSTMTRGLIWEFTSPDGTRQTGIPAAGALLTTPAGQSQLPAEATVRLWHPARAATAEVGQWREHLAVTGLSQPFKQAFREVYLLTPAELETRVYSNRFAAHILRYRQTYALFKERGWTANFLGSYDGGYEGYARRDFPDAGLTAVFAHSQLEADHGQMGVTLCGTDQVSFSRAGDRRHAPIPLAEVPELVFTEAMRDVDLFISVTSIALDPRWADRGENPYLDYWHQYSFGDLSQTATIRRDALARILPRLKIAPQLELTDRHVRVQGKLSSYKIHIGSGNILIEPDDRYLCIVPENRAPKVMLPFEGDHVLSIVLSKAVLLAADDKITDPTIVRQLRSR